TLVNNTAINTAKVVTPLGQARTAARLTAVSPRQATALQAAARGVHQAGVARARSEAAFAAAGPVPTRPDAARTLKLPTAPAVHPDADPLTLPGRIGGPTRGASATVTAPPRPLTSGATTLPSL